MSLPRPVRIVATLLLALAGAWLCVWLHTPIPWMLGPLLVTTLVTLAGLPTQADVVLRNVAQGVLGVSLGLYFTPEIVQQLARLWWAVLLSVLWALALGAWFGRWLAMLHARRFPDLPPATLHTTTYYASAIGAASEMTLQAERVGARADLVASAHSLRVLIVVLVVPYAMLWARTHAGWEAVDVAPAALRQAVFPGLLWLSLAAAAGGWVTRRIGLTNPWFLGPLFVAMAVSIAERVPSPVPTALSNAAQLVIGVGLGVRFTPKFLEAAPAWLVSVAVGTLAMILLCAGFGAVLASWAGLPLGTAILATAPGGMAEMAITAKVLQLGVPVVTAFQVSRLVAVLLLVQPFHRWTQSRRG